MQNSLQNLASGNVAKVAQQVRVKKKIRENTELMNMLLKHLETPDKEFKDSFGSGRKTVVKYSEHASVLFGLGIRRVKKYDTNLANEITSFCKSHSRIFHPVIAGNEANDPDLMKLVVTMRGIKKHIRLLKAQPNSPIDLAAKQLNLSELIRQIASFLTIEKLVRNNACKISETLQSISSREFYFNYMNAYEVLDVELHTKREATVNRRHLYSIRAIIIGSINRQNEILGGTDPEVSSIDARDPIYVDRLVSTILSLIE